MYIDFSLERRNRECCPLVSSHRLSKTCLSANRCGFPIRRVLLVHDKNARPHAAAVIQQKLEQMEWTLLEYPPSCSSELLIYDYYLFGLLKKALEGRFKYDHTVKTFVCK